MSCGVFISDLSRSGAGGAVAFFTVVNDARKCSRSNQITYLIHSAGVKIWILFYEYSSKLYGMKMNFCSKTFSVHFILKKRRKICVSMSVFE